MKIPVDWSRNFLESKGIYDLIRFTKGNRFNEKDVQANWLDKLIVEKSVLHNTITLLYTLDVIIEEKAPYYIFNKKYHPRSLRSLHECLLDRLIDRHSHHILQAIPFDCITFDTAIRLFTFYRNDVPLKYSGLINFLSDINSLRYINNYRVAIEGGELQKIVMEAVDSAKQQFSKITPEALRRLLDKQNLIGEASEIHALTYENNRLTNLGINKQPLRISEMDVSQGFDIMSFEFTHSMDFDRFIEVKTFSGNTFYMSKNELRKAQELGEQYYIYLVSYSECGEPNIEEVKNPARQLKDINRWGIEPSSYAIVKFP
ncbi:DUF3883 domain-containing protein [Candidatus Saccharibacteria bacterium]|nr:DUF3883 domain-containing protein [Candidatus Saccharibacteria bacterium]